LVASARLQCGHRYGRSKEKVESKEERSLRRRSLRRKWRRGRGIRCMTG
jgi:hypothetical protein